MINNIKPTTYFIVFGIALGMILSSSLLWEGDTIKSVYAQNGNDTSVNEQDSSSAVVDEANEAPQTTTTATDPIPGIDVKLGKGVIKQPTTTSFTASGTPEQVGQQIAKKLQESMSLQGSESSMAGISWSCTISYPPWTITCTLNSS